jgi:hypothetical protein
MRLSAMPRDEEPAESSEQIPEIPPSVSSNQAETRQKERRFWDTRFVITTAVLALLALVAAYLQYSVYPSIMVNQFGESNPTLHLSFMTYAWNANKCLFTNPCTYAMGLPSFDFAQFFSLLLLLALVYHYIKLRK